MSSIKIKVPFAKGFDDYHGIDDFVDSINECASPPLQSVEVAFYNGVYIGVFYVGSQPDNKVLKKIVKESFEVNNGINWKWEERLDNHL